jgi:hypothetical protein
MGQDLCGLKMDCTGFFREYAIVIAHNPDARTFGTDRNGTIEY